MLVDFVFQLLMIAGVLLLVFQMQTIQKYEDLAGPAESQFPWSLARRGTITGQALAMCWMAIHRWELGEEPSLPILVFFAVFDVNLLIRIIVMRKNTKDAASGKRRVLTVAARPEESLSGDSVR